MTTNWPGRLFPQFFFFSVGHLITMFRTGIFSAVDEANIFPETFDHRGGEVAEPGDEFWQSLGEPDGVVGDEHVSVTGRAGSASELTGMETASTTAAARFLWGRLPRSDRRRSRIFPCVWPVRRSTGLLRRFGRGSGIFQMVPMGLRPQAQVSHHRHPCVSEPGDEPILTLARPLVSRSRNLKVAPCGRHS